MTQNMDRQRLDLWLWHARFIKNRAIAEKLVQAGSVRINRRPIEKVHARVAAGDVLTLAMNGQLVVVRVRELGKRRGPFSEACMLYEILPD